MENLLTYRYVLCVVNSMPDLFIAINRLYWELNSKYSKTNCKIYPICQSYCEFYKFTLAEYNIFGWIFISMIHRIYHNCKIPNLFHISSKLQYPKSLKVNKINTQASTFFSSFFIIAKFTKFFSFKSTPPANYLRIKIFNILPKTMWAFFSYLNRVFPVHCRHFM